MIRSVALAGLFAIIGLGSLGFIGTAYGVYAGNVGDEGQTGKNTLEESLYLARERIVAAQANEGAGSGTPYFDADGVLGSTALAGAIFGGIAGALFLRARSGKYAAQGRG